MIFLIKSYLCRNQNKQFVFSPTQMLPYFRSMEAFFDLSLPKSWADLSDPQLLFFFRQLATDKPMAEIQTLCLCQWANVLVRCRLYGSVYLVQHGKQHATLTLHQSVCAITAIDYLKSFPPYPIRIRTIGKAAAMEANFQGVPFSSFISHRQHPLRMGFSRQLRPLPSPLPTHLRHRVLHPPHRGISDTKHHRHSEQHTFSKGQRIR